MNLLNNSMILLIENSETSSWEIFFYSSTLNYFAPEISSSTKPIQSKNTVMHKILSPTTKFEKMEFIGSMNSCSKLIDKFHVKIKPLYALLRNLVEVHWIKDLGIHFQQN